MSWSRSLSPVPKSLTIDRIQAYSASRSLGNRNDERSHKFVAESYVQCASIETSPFTIRDSRFVRVRARCFRSQKKTASPYQVSVVITQDGFIDGCTCECAARESGVCHHALALLKLLVLLKKQGYEEPPPELSCTELPQKWRRPRGDKISSSAVDDVDWRSVRPGGRECATASRLYEARKKPRLAEDVKKAALKFGQDLAELAPTPFSKHLQAMTVKPSSSAYGETCEGSMLWSQKPLMPHHFSTHISPEIKLGSTSRGADSVPPEQTIIPSTSLYVASSQNLPASQKAILESLTLTITEAHKLEKSSRGQNKSAAWQAARRQRLTASNFGAVMKRENWTVKGLKNLTAERDLSRVRAIQYGISNELQAIRQYATTMQALQHDVQTFHCGLAVSPACPWLGASPDRIVWDPEEGSHGIIEVKCPYSMKDVDFPRLEGSCLVKDATGVIRLDRQDAYYYQVLGQMALTGLTWADFVVYSPHFIVIERIRFDEAAWQLCRNKLDKFYFDTLLPFLAEQ